LLLGNSELNRLRALKELAFGKKGFDGFLAFNGTNQQYLSGVPGTVCTLIPSKGQGFILVYNVNYEQAKAEADGFKVEQVKRGENVFAKISALTERSRIKKLAIDAIGYDSYRALAKELKRQTRLKIRPDFVSQLRQIKDVDELRLMRKAGVLTSEGMKAAYDAIRPGIKEIEVAAEIEYAMRKRYSWGTAFETIVASGARSAYPHGGCTDRQIRNGDLVVVDIGARYHEYCSDMTRTMVAGKASEKQKKLYNIVKQAHESAFEAIKPNAKGRDIDTAARKVIANAGYGEYFCHGLGHGVGLEVHEGPTLNSESKDKLKVGNVVTDEPGIYLVGFGGIRIEDSVLVQTRRPEKLTEGPYAMEAEG
jgi:Xaa-Pro aminopeptidase